MTLSELRAKIDELDKKIVGLLNERARLVQEIGKVKAREGKPVYAPNREQEVYNKVAANNPGPLSNDCLRAVYRELMSGSFALEKPLKVAYLGPEGTFTHVAARERFGSGVTYVPAKGIDAVFSDVATGRADYGVVPIENSTEGGINDTLEMFIESDLRVCAEIILRIRHTLLANCRLEDVRRVCSKSQALGQCRRWLGEHLPNAELKEVASTSEAARMATCEPGTAAIAYAGAADLYGLKILAQSIEDSPNNFTRFFVLSKTFGDHSGHDKTSIMCSIKDEVGALYGILLPFKHHGINLTKIESFPSKQKPWTYWFFIDFEGHCADKPVTQALEEVKTKCSEMKVLGSFPKAK